MNEDYVFISLYQFINSFIAYYHLDTESFTLKELSYHYLEWAMLQGVDFTNVNNLIRFEKEFGEILLRIGVR